MACQIARFLLRESERVRKESCMDATREISAAKPYATSEINYMPVVSADVVIWWSNDENHCDGVMKISDLSAALPIYHVRQC